MPINRPRCWMLAGAASLSLASPLFAQPNDNLVVPGQRVGALRVGASEAELLRVKGDPDPTRTTTTRDGARYIYSNDVEVFVKGGQVDMVCAQNTKYATSEGVRIGIAPLRVNAAMPPPTRVVDRGTALEQWYWPGLFIGIGHAEGQAPYVMMLCATR